MVPGGMVRVGVGNKPQILLATGVQPQIQFRKIHSPVEGYFQRPSLKAQHDSDQYIMLKGALRFSWLRLEPLNSGPMPSGRATRRPPDPASFDSEAQRGWGSFGRLNPGE